ncbi:MAG: CHASE2 domain-containing protein [Gammaproteobacteria bacterium]|nr:CHASE2 domain-containing protein [Gammaproteobacteria bacterium]
MKAAFWKRDWFLGLAIAVFIIILHKNTIIVQNLEYAAYDFGVAHAERAPSDRIAIIAIDEKSLENLGRWPWSRDIHADMIHLLADSQAKVIAYTPIFSEAQRDPGLRFIDGMVSLFKQNNMAPAGIAPLNPEALSSNSPEAVTNSSNKPFMTELWQYLISAEDALNVDRKLAASFVEAHNVVTPMVLLLGPQFGNPDAALPAYITAHAITKIEDSLGVTGMSPDEALNYAPLTANKNYAPLTANKLIPPIAELGQSAGGIGNINGVNEHDGGSRTDVLVTDYYGTYLPSYSLLLAAKSLNLTPSDITLRLGESVQLGKLNIITGDSMLMNTFFYRANGDTPPFPVNSFFDVLTGQVNAAQFKDKIVIVGFTASGLGALQKTPVNALMTEPELYAHRVSSILNEDFFVKPKWGKALTLGALLLVTLFLMFGLPRLSAMPGAAITVGAALTLFITQYLLLTSQTLWVELMLPLSLLLLGYTILTTGRFLVTERGKQHSDLESAESNKMLGLAFQGQGQLDMAFEKFRKCPKDESVAEALYNLALDYERKRQFAKAGNVYRYIAEFAPQFRDVAQRIERSKKMEDTIILGGRSGGGGHEGTLILDNNAIEKPMLGRYQIEKELGKGAMGVVYLGRDPKIGRVVAIKTMALSQEFDADELVEVKERFFREAETAGRLNHPHIVTIYDAGEEQDLAYIAMEFLKGHDMAPYTKKDKLLPLNTVVNLVKQAAEALAYAHAQNVVHRDIKPANIMYEPESNQVKITDFGIARITDNSKTKTGVVLGTPSYMSPEQLSGRKVDGRSDLFSLGVMLYQLISGELPFKADSMATLMYKIANEDTPSVLDVRADAPGYLEVIVARAMEKNPDERYQNGEEMARDLSECLKQMGG